jgi:hypothetical protein
MGVGVQAFRRRFPRLARNPTTQQSTGKILTSENPEVEWLMPAWLFLQLAGTSTQPLEAIAEQFGWSMPRCRELLARAAAIAAIREERGGKVRRITMLQQNASKNSAKAPNHFWPKKPRECGLNLALQYERRVTAIVHSNPHLVRHALGGYLHNVWSTRCIPVFRNPFLPEEACHYVHFLEAIGLQKSSLQFIHFNPARRSRFRKQWRSALQLNWRYAKQIIYYDPLFRRNSASDRWLAILPVFDRAHGSRVTDPLKGFHFLLIMAAIAFGYDRSPRPASALDAS